VQGAALHPQGGFLKKAPLTPKNFYELFAEFFAVLF
jgi:hypothetical protein